MYRFELRFNYLYALALIFLIVGMALWAFIPPKPASVLPEGEVVLSPDTNVQFVGRRGLVTTPFSDYNSALGQEVTAWVKTLPINSVEEAASWVLSHTYNPGDPYQVDSTNAFQLLQMIKNGKSVVKAVCDQITDMFLIIVYTKGFAGAGTQAIVKVKGGSWDGAEHAVAVVVSKDGSQAFFFYTWPYGIYSVSYYDGLGWSSGDYPTASNALSGLENTLKAHPENFPTSDGWYSVSSLSSVKQQPKNATVESGTGCPLYGSYNKIEAPENCTTCPKKPGTQTVAEGEPSGNFYAWIQNGTILFKAVLNADWPQSDQVGFNVFGSLGFFLTCVETGRTIRVDAATGTTPCHCGFWGGCDSCETYFTQNYAFEPSTGWYPIGGGTWSYSDLGMDKILLITDQNGNPTNRLGGKCGLSPCPTTVIIRNYVWDGKRYSPRQQIMFPLKDFKSYLLGGQDIKTAHLTFTIAFPRGGGEACLSLGAGGVCLWKVVVYPKTISMTLVWDTTSDTGFGEAKGNLTLILNQEEYFPGSNATAFLKAGEAITSVQASYDSTPVNFVKDSADGKVWKSVFRVPDKEGVYNLTARTNLGVVSASFKVTSNPVQEPIIVKFSRDPPVYKIGEKVQFDILVNLNGTYDISAYVTSPSGAIQGVQLSKVSEGLFSGTFDNTAWAGNYKLSISVDGTGCFFADKQMNKVKKEVTFTVEGTPYSIKVWFDKEVYKPGDRVRMWISVNPSPQNVTATLETGVSLSLMQVEGLYKAEFVAPSTKGDHYVLVTADGFSVQAKYTVGDAVLSPKLIVMTDRDSYAPSSTVRIIGYIQNGEWGKGVSNPKVVVTKPNGQSVEITPKYFQNDPEREDLIYAYFSDTSSAGNYKVRMEVTYGYIEGTGDRLVGETTFTVLGGITNITNQLIGTNANVYDWLTSHGVPPELAKILAMPITWIALGVLVILLARRRKYEGYSGRLMR